MEEGRSVEEPVANIAPPPTERIEIGGLRAAVSVVALRALLDPATRDEATIDVDLSQLSLNFPTAALNDVLARLMPTGEATVGDEGVTLRPGGGSPGVRVRVPATGVRVKIRAVGIQVDAE